jgi:hypothetical protein
MPEDEAEELLQDLERGELRAVMAALKTVEPEKPDGTVN